MEENIPKFVLYKKLLILGDGGVGKSAMTSVLESNEPIDEESIKESK